MLQFYFSRFSLLAEQPGLVFLPCSLLHVLDKNLGIYGWLWDQAGRYVYYGLLIILADEMNFEVAVSCFWELSDLFYE